ncbi:MAG: hypothetical protein O7D28_04595 [Actinobacteria bacterium]|nr:hypothetical protein [Actinomycetota bacterium]
MKDFLQLAATLVVLLQRFVGERLEDLDVLAAFPTGVFVCWHGKSDRLGSGGASQV